LRGRMEKSGADLSKCLLPPRGAAGSSASICNLTFESPYIEQFVRENELSMLVLDPMQAFLGASVDMHRANETRPVLAKLAAIASRNKCAIVIVAHTAKSRDGKSPVSWALGSQDIPGAARSVLQLIRDPNNGENRLAVHVKSNNAKMGQTIQYKIIDRGGVQWLGNSLITIDDLQWIEKRKEKETVGVDYDTEPLVQVFRQIITDRPGGGFISYADLKAEGMKILGFPPFGKSSDLKAKLDTNFCRELQEKDGLIVTCGVTGKQNSRGIRIEQYKVPVAYQSKLFDKI